MLLAVPALSASSPLRFRLRPERGKYHGLHVLCVACISLLVPFHLSVRQYVAAETRYGLFCASFLRHRDHNYKKRGAGNDILGLVLDLVRTLNELCGLSQFGGSVADGMGL